ncbi:MAG: tetratricopeptide repeat protein [Planctomycetes bacterium]|nr:tetratricopeptide repeat protein [Planctomycetota bacterium]
MSNHRPIVTAARLLTLAAAAWAGGCASHGNYTAEHMSAAKVKMDGLKAATEYQMAHQAFLAGDLEKGLRHVDRSLSLNPKVAKSHVLKGRVYLEMNDLEKSSACFAQASEIEATNVEAQYYQGVLCERVARKEEALGHYQKAAELDGANAQYCIAASEMLIDLGRVDEAKAYLESRAGNFTNNAGVKQSLGNIAMLRGDSVTAEKLFQDARLLAPDDAMIIESLVRAQMANQKFAEADTNLTRMLENGGGDHRRDLMHMHARCLTQLDRTVEARTVYLELTRDQQGQSDVAAWKGLGETAFILRDSMHLKAAAGRLVAMAPQSPDGYVLRGLMSRQAGQLPAALSNFQQAAKLAKTGDNLVLLGMTQQDMNLLAQAKQSYKTALEVDPRNATAAKLLAAVPEQ